jgi:transcriptional regulator with XRE-family HTH domain
VTALGALLRSARRARGWRLAEVAARVGYSVPMVSRWETGERPPPVAALPWLGAALGVPADALAHAASCDASEALERRAAPPVRPLVDGTTRYADDVAAQLFVLAHPGGAAHESVAEALGVTRQRVAQIEEVALRKLRLRMQIAGISAADVVGREHDAWLYAEGAEG